MTTPAVAEMNEPHSRRSILKQATDHLHRELDDAASNYELRDAAHYAAFLEASAGPLIALERMIESAGVAQLLPDWSERRRADLLLDDLNRLGRPVTPPVLRRASPSRSEMFGILYVLEGSRLGARWLYARVCSSPDAKVGEARSYLAAHNPSLWRSFLEILESSPHATDAQEMISGARYAFVLFQRSLEREAERCGRWASERGGLAGGPGLGGR